MRFREKGTIKTYTKYRSGKTGTPHTQSPTIPCSFLASFGVKTFKQHLMERTQRPDGTVGHPNTLQNQGLPLPRLPPVQKAAAVQHRAPRPCQNHRGHGDRRDERRPAARPAVPGPPCRSPAVGTKATEGRASVKGMLLTTILAVELYFVWCFPPQHHACSFATWPLIATSNK